MTETASILIIMLYQNTVYAVLYIKIYLMPEHWSSMNQPTMIKNFTTFAVLEMAVGATSSMNVVLEKAVNNMLNYSVVVSLHLQTTHKINVFT